MPLLEVAALTGAAATACKFIQGGMNAVSNIQQCERNLDSARVRMAALESELAHAKKEGSSKAEELETSLASLTVEFETLKKEKEDADVAAGTAVDEAAAKLRAAVAQVATREADIAALREKLSAAEKAGLTLSNDLASARVVVAEGTAREARLEDELAAAHRIQASARAELEEAFAMSHRLSEALAEAYSLEEETITTILSERDEAAATLAAAHAEFQAQLAAVTEEAELQKREAAAEMAAAKALAEVVDAAAAENCAVKNQMEEMRREQDVAAEHAADAARTNERLKEEAAATAAELEALRAALAKADAEKEELRRERDAAAAHTAALEAAMERELGESTAADAAIKELKKEIEGLRKENEAAAARAVAAEVALAMERAEAEEAKKVAAEKLDKTIKTSKKKTGRIAALEGRVSELEAAKTVAVVPEQEEREDVVEEYKENTPDANAIIQNPGRTLIANSVDVMPSGGRGAYEQHWDVLLVQDSSCHPGLLKSMIAAKDAVLACLDEARRLEGAIGRDGSAALAAPGSEADAALKARFTDIYGTIRHLSVTLAALNATDASKKAATDCNILEEEALLGWALRQGTLVAGLLARFALPGTAALAEADTQLLAWVKEVCSGVRGRVVALIGYGWVGYGLTREEVVAHARDAVAKGHPSPECIDLIMCSAVQLPPEAAPAPAPTVAPATGQPVEQQIVEKAPTASSTPQQLKQQLSAEQQQLQALFKDLKPAKTRHEAPAAPCPAPRPVNYLAALKKPAPAQTGKPGGGGSDGALKAPPGSGASSAASSPTIGAVYANGAFGRKRGVNGGGQKTHGGNGNGRSRQSPPARS